MDGISGIPFEKLGILKLQKYQTLCYNRLSFEKLYVLIGKVM